MEHRPRARTLQFPTTGLALPSFAHLVLLFTVCSSHPLSLSSPTLTLVVRAARGASLRRARDVPTLCLSSIQPPHLVVTTRSPRPHSLICSPSSHLNDPAKSRLQEHEFLLHIANRVSVVFARPVETDARCSYSKLCSLARIADRACICLPRRLLNRR
jgi:hypothetical protein